MELISREDAIKDAESWVAVDDYEKHLQKKVVEWLKEFPSSELSTNLASLGTDCISRQAAIDVIDNFNCFEFRADQIALEIKIRNLPSAQPRGKWIYHIDDLFPAESTKECDQCHAEQPLICDDEFCPHCGAKMEVTT